MTEEEAPEMPEYEALINLDVSREHRKDGAGTRETNPLYRGEYTIEEYKADQGRTWESAKTAEARARLWKFWDYEIEMGEPLESKDPTEWGRYNKARTEALGRYTGPKEWPHGYTLEETARRHNLTMGRYYQEFYELTDTDLAVAMDALMGEYAGRTAAMSDRHGELMEALEGNNVWPNMLEDLNEAYGAMYEFDKDLLGRPKMAENADELARIIIWELFGTSDREEIKDPDGPLAYTIDRLQREINRVWPTATDIWHLQEMGKGYRPLQSYLKETLGLKPENILYVIEKLAFGDHPPETITPEIKERIEPIYWEIVESYRERIESEKKKLDALKEKIAELTTDPAEERQILKDMGITGGQPDKLYVPTNDFFTDSRKKLSNVQTTLDPESGIYERIAKDIIIESDKNNNQNEWLRMNLIVGNHEPPSLTDLGFIEQLGAEREAILKKGGSLKLTELQLIRRRYGLDPDTTITPETRAEFKRRFEELSEIRVLIPAISRSNLDTSKDGEYLEKIYSVAEKVRLIEPKIEIGYTDKNKDKLIDVYTFENPIPIHHVNAWHGKIIRVNWDLIRTDPIPVEELSSKSRAHYDEDKLKGGKRTNRLYMDPIAYMDLKYCILHSLLFACGFTQKGQTRLKLNLEEIYKATYGKPAPPKRSDEWKKTYIKAVYSYLTFLIEKGCIVDFEKGERNKNGYDSGTVFVFIEEGNRMLFPPREEI